MWIGIFRNGTYTMPYSSVEQMQSANKFRLRQLCAVMFGHTEKEAERKAIMVLQKLATAH